MECSDGGSVSDVTIESGMHNRRAAVPAQGCHGQTHLSWEIIFLAGVTSAEEVAKVGTDIRPLYPIVPKSISP